MAGKPQKAWRRRKELLLDITYPEDAKRKWAIRKMIEEKDEQIRKEQEAIMARGFCPHCNMVRTTTGACSMGCG